MPRKREATNLVADENVEFVVCPYCEESKQYEVLHWKHLKTHGKTLKDVREEFPNLPTITKKGYEKKCQTAQKGTQASIETMNEMVTKTCFYYGKDPRCSGETRTTPKNISWDFVCDTCLGNGHAQVDGRRLESANEARVHTLQKNHGDEVTNAAHVVGVREKKIQTNQEKYGGIGFASEELRQKAQETSQKRYGVSNWMKTREAQDLHRGPNGISSKENNPIRAERISKSLKGKSSQLKGRTYEDIHGQDKAQELKTDRARLFIERSIDRITKEWKDLDLELIDSTYLGAHTRHRWKCTICETEFEQLWNNIQQGYLCPTCYPRSGGTSVGEKELLSFIRSLLPDETIIENCRQTIPPKELDIYIPSFSLAFEFNGLCYHHVESKYDCQIPLADLRIYHREKTNACLEKGIRLIQIFEDEWYGKRRIVCEFITNLLGQAKKIPINARDCEVRNISNQEKDYFLNTYHLQGSDIATFSNLGLFHQDILVAVMTFKSFRYKKKELKLFELNRFCVRPDYNVRGGAGKLLAHFISNNEWKKIYSYCDRRWFTGELYEKLGFIREKGIRLNYWYMKNNIRYHRSSLRKKSTEDPNVKESILRIQQGYYRVWDAGNILFRLDNSSD